MTETPDLVRQLTGLERWLLHSDHRRDEAALERVLADELREVAASGHEVSRAQVRDWLLAKDPLARWEFSDTRVQVLGPGLVLLQYHARQVAGAGMKPQSAGSRRCSFWRRLKAPGEWQLCFHQATAVQGV